MKFHGRIAPGKLTDLSKPLQILIHAPAKLAGATIKIWELDTFEQDGEVKSEGSADDLLATFQGDIEPAPKSSGARAPDWRAFKVNHVKIEDADPDVARVKIQFAGSDTTYEIPIISELDEVEGDSYELGFSIEVGGAEKFKTRSPALVIPPMRPLRLVARYVQDATPDQIVDDTMYEEPLAYRHVAIGTRTTTDPTAKFKILATGYSDADGYLLDRDPAERGDAPPRPLIVRAGRELFLLDDAEPITKMGVTELPIAMCDQIVGKDHDLVVVRSAVPHPMSLRIAERPADGERAFGTAKVEAPKITSISSLFTFGGARGARGGET